MKVTICFDHVKIIVPCGNQTNEDDKINNNNLKVSDVIENAILRYKKATGKPNTCVIKVLNLQTIRDGGILDPDDYIRDVVEDKELLSAIYEEYQNEVLISSKKPILSQLSKNRSKMTIEVNCNRPNSLENSGGSNGSNVGGAQCVSKHFKAPFASQITNQLDNYCYIKRNQVLVPKTDVNKSNNPSNLRVKSGSESCIYNNILKTNAPNLSLITVNTSNLHQANTKNMPDTETNYFSRASSNRQSIVKNENNLWANSVHADDYAEILNISLNNENSPAQPPRPLGIHVIPSHDSNTQKDSGLIIQQIEPNGRVHKDGRLQVGDRIIEINGKNLVDTDFAQCQEMLREAIVASNADCRLLELKVARLKPNGQTSEDKENTNEIKNFNSTSTNLNVMNTKKLGKKITVQLTKGPQGLGFKLAARDNCTPGEYSPIYIKNILPKGAAVTDGRLQRGDRLLEVNQIDMTQKTLHEAVNILRNTKLGDCVEIVVSRQVMPMANYGLPRELNEPNGEEAKSDEKSSPKRELLTYEIALNDTGSAGLGVSVKGKTKRLEDSENSVDLGIFVKTVINGGAASKDGRLKPNDQLININGFSLLGKSNEEAMLILREAMQVESRPGHIELTVSRKIKSEAKNDDECRQFVKIISHNNRKMEDVEEDRVPRFNRDAPNRRSMSEKRLKLGPVPANFQTRRNQSIDPKRSQTIQGISSIANNNFSPQSNSIDSDESKIPRSTTCSASISSMSNYTYNSSHETEARPIEPKIKKNFCMPITCKSSRLRYKKPLERRPKSSTSSTQSISLTLSDSSGSLSPENRHQFIESLTYSKLKPIEYIAEDFSDFSRRSSDQDENGSNKPPKPKSCFNIKLLKNSYEQNLIVQDQTEDTTPYYTQVKARKSTSMESIPQNVPETKTKSQKPVVNIHNKFGTVSGASVQNRPSVLPKESEKSADVGVNRFRAVNRSFRTAVDKSLDVPVQSNVARQPEGFVKRLIHSFNMLESNVPSRKASVLDHKREEIQNEIDGSKRMENRKLVEAGKSKDTKSLIGKFQNLFKSSSAKKSSTEDVNQTSNGKQAVELVNFHKIDSNPRLVQTVKSLPNQNNTKPPIDADVIIDNDTMYTQYRPDSAKTMKPTQSQIMPKPFFANRDSLFYHSTDNHRMTYSQRQQHFITEQQRMLRQQQKKFMEQQEKLKEIEETNCFLHKPKEIRNYEDFRPKKSGFIHHSIPFNGSNQVRPVAELFNEVANQFDRMNVNQMSTKSQPPISANYQRDLITSNKNSFVNNEIPLSGSSAMSSSSASSSSSTSVSDRFCNQHSMLIQPHPAQV
ncbi:partitioning defective 3 -like protein [Brachionus plicatilis]|uniref:Partitioning defective 3-like protein n=1 Tax=Brachionus plicatilis TaxID=10195 RepID=A0A3M7PI08_BRAPC|nr:partitioning defective 3 -like protein [Brachionus plicatilis]